MADFKAEVFQNEYLSAGSTDVHAVVSVTCTNAGAAGQTGGAAAEIVIIDTSGSMDMPVAKINAARRAAAVAVNEVIDGTWFAVLSGHSIAQMVYPPTPGMVKMSSSARADALGAISRLRSGGATAIGAWIAAATELFDQLPGSPQCHAILLTDGKVEGEPSTALPAALRRARGRFQCDCRGVGDDWQVDELRGIADALLGTVDIVARPDDLEADFESMMRTAMSRGVADARLRVWAPQGSEVLFVRQVAPAVEDLTAKAEEVTPLVRQYPTGAWSDESRDYHIAVRVPVADPGQERLAARVEVVIDDDVVAKGLVRAVWSTDVQLTTKINPAVAHYTGQAQLAEAIRDGLAARAAGDDRTATVLLGKAAKLAHESGNENTTRLLSKVVDVVDADAGTVRLRNEVAKADEMALDTRSTKTTRIRRDGSSPGTNG